MDRKKQLENELSRIIKLLLQEYKPEQVILFGSLANGKVHEWSDIDLAVIKNTNKRFIDRIGEVLQLTHPQVSLNIVVYTPQEVLQMKGSNHQFWINEISSKGKILYDRAA